MSRTAPELDAAAVCAEYGPSQATSVDRHNDLCRWVLGWWIKKNGYVVEKRPDGTWALFVKCEDVCGNESLAHAYEGTEEECLKAAESLRRLV